MMRGFGALLAVVLLLAGCTTDPVADDSTAPPTTLSPTSTTMAPTSTARPATATTSTTTSSTTLTPPTPTATPSTTTTLPALTDLESGLFCRDLVAMGYDYANAVTYWVRDGSPDRMDADRNGIPCQTVYEEDEVLAFWGDPLPTTTVVTIVFAPADPVLFPEVRPGSDGAHGSGCAPGTDWLPDGIWFGYVTDRSANRIDFDLACIWTGATAEQEAAADGLTLETGYYIRNIASKIRSPQVASGATVYHLTGNPWFTELTYSAWRQGSCHGFESVSCPVWLYVNGGQVTAVIEQYFA
jgi:hypothetical protein